MEHADAGALLIVEDSDDDYALARWALRRAGYGRPIRRAIRVAEALALLAPDGPGAASGAPPFAVVLLDLDLPDGTGLDLLSALRADCGGVLPLPIVILTTSNNPRDIAGFYRLGIAGYLVKPLERGRFADQIRAFVDYWFDAVTLPPLDHARAPGRG